MENASQFLTNIEIDKEHIQQIKDEMSMIGFKENSLYPSLENLSLEISHEFNL